MYYVDGVGGSDNRSAPARRFRVQISTYCTEAQQKDGSGLDTQFFVQVQKAFRHYDPSRAAKLNRYLKFPSKRKVLSCRQSVCQIRNWKLDLPSLFSGYLSE